TIMHRRKNRSLAGFALAYFVVQFSLAPENSLQANADALRFLPAFDQKSARLLAAADFINQLLHSTPRHDPGSPDEKDSRDCRSSTRRAENPENHFSGRRKPKPRPVSTISRALPSFSRNRRTWVSTVRVSITLS